MITATLLTPAGAGAIAVIAIHGHGIYALVRQLFFAANRQALPIEPKSGVRFGNFGDPTGDEVILAIHHDELVEIHSHGGAHVVRWIFDRLAEYGVTRSESSTVPKSGDIGAWRLLPFAKTVRCASILLDQARGAFLSATEFPTSESLAVLRRNANVGSHLVTPWNVVIAGQPNAGKSSLLNALVGYARSVVSPVPGTTRDTVSTEVAFDGWPIRLTDTAGLRETVDELEEEGIRRANTQFETADLIIWLIDLAEPRGPQLAQLSESLQPKTLTVFTKIDIFPNQALTGPGVSTLTGEGISELISMIVKRLIPAAPLPGEPVPYSPALARSFLN